MAYQSLHNMMKPMCALELCSQRVAIAAELDFPAGCSQQLCPQHSREMLCLGQRTATSQIWQAPDLLHLRQAHPPQPAHPQWSAGQAQGVAWAGQSM